MTLLPEKHSRPACTRSAGWTRETSGLLLLSDDGAWSHRVTSPNHRCSKTYLARLPNRWRRCRTTPSTGPDVAQRNVGDAPCGIARLDGHACATEHHGGRYHQVRRMFERRSATGCSRCIVSDRRTGPDPSLQPGDWRHLTELEREAVLGSEIVD